MKKLISLFILLIFVIGCANNAEEKKAEKMESDSDETYFVAVEKMPAPIGGVAAIQKNIVYPELAKKAGIQGRVFVKAFINSQGDVDKVEVIRGIGAGCDEAAVEAIKKVKWRPGIQRGENVPVQVAVPVVFKLNDKNASKDVSSSYKKLNVMKQNLNGKCRVTGRLMNKSGELLIGGNINIEGTKLGAATDMYGNYVVSKIPPGKYKVKASYVDYNQFEVPNLELKPNTITVLDITLSEK